MAKSKNKVPKSGTLKTRAHGAMYAWKRFANAAWRQGNGKAKANKQACRKKVSVDD